MKCSTFTVVSFPHSNSDIVLWKAASNDGNPTMKWIPWKTDPDSKVKAIAFQPASMESVSEDKIELLIISESSDLQYFRYSFEMKLTCALFFSSRWKYVHN